MYIYIYINSEMHLNIQYIAYMLYSGIDTLRMICTLVRVHRLSRPSLNWLQRIPCTIFIFIKYY